MTSMGLNAVLRKIVHIFGIRVAGAWRPVITAVAVTAMAKQMHRDEANGHGKPYPIVLKPIHAMSPLSDRFANVIAMPGTGY